MRCLPFMLGILVAAAIGAPARAVEYPWCAEYAYDNGGTNCGFVSREQCMATVSGVGGYCMQNLRYVATVTAAPAAHHRPRTRSKAHS